VPGVSGVREVRGGAVDDQLLCEQSDISSGQADLRAVLQLQEPGHRPEQHQQPGGQGRARSSQRPAQGCPDRRAEHRPASYDPEHALQR